MDWKVLIGFSIFADACGRIVQRTIMKADQSDPIASAIFYQIIGGCFLLVYAIITGFVIPDLSSIWLNLLLVPILWGASNILIFKSLKTTEASVFTILFTTRAVWIILLALFFLSEAFSVRQIVGTAFILLSIVLVSWQKKKIALKRGEILALIAAIGFGAAIINDSVIVRTFDVESYLGLNFLSSAIFIWLVNIKSTKKIARSLKPSAFGGILLLGVVYALSTIFYFLAYKGGGSASQIGAIYPVSAILTVLFAIALLHERESLVKKVIAIFISFIGVFLVS